MIKRKHWSAGVTPKRVVKHPVTSAGGAVDTVVLHHSVTGSEPFETVLRSIERFHINGEFYDIAYNFLMNDKNTAEGRGAFVQGGATGAGMDASSLSICVLGDYETAGKHVVSADLVDGLAGLLVDLVKMGVVAPGFNLAAHSDFKATACCGVRLKAEIPRVMRIVHAAISGVTEPRKLTDAQKLKAIEAILKG